MQLFCHVFTLKAKYQDKWIIRGGECDKGIRCSKLRIIGAVYDVIRTKNTPKFDPKISQMQLFCQVFTLKAKYLDKWIIRGGECDKGIRCSKFRIIGAVYDVIRTKNTQLDPKISQMQLFCQVFTLKAKYQDQQIIGGGECNKGIRYSTFRIIGAVYDVIRTKNTPN